MKIFRGLKDIEKLSLLETAQDLFHFVENFGECENQKTLIPGCLKTIQKTETSTCGPFQIYFYDNSFFPGENSKLHSYKKLTKKAVETLLNKTFSLDQE